MLNRRKLLIATAAVVAAPAAARAAPPAGSPALKRAFDVIVDLQLAASPETATTFALDRGAHADAIHHLDDRSLAGRAGLHLANRRQLAELDRIDRKALTGADAINYDAIRYGLELQVAADARFDKTPGPGFPYVLSQLTGAYQSVPDFLETSHRIETRDDAEAYLDRLRGFARALDQDSECAAHDVAAGVVPPDFALDKALTQLRAIRAEPAERSELVNALARRAHDKQVPGDWAARAATLYTAEVLPALDRQIALVERMRASATPDAGVWKLPDGDAFYDASLKFWTSSQMSVEEIHRTGVDLVAEVSARLDEALKGQGLTTGTVGDRLRALGEDERYFYPNTDPGREALLADLRLMVKTVEARLPARIATLPKAELQIRRYPKNLELGRSAGSYNWPALDGSRPGFFQINLRDTHEMPKWKLPTLVYHETVPGHHLQLSLQSEADLPLVRRMTSFNAYIEGWALYAEDLADEMGMYEHDPAGRIGYLSSVLYRAIRLVVDTGMHRMRWSRDQALDYFTGHNGNPVAGAASEVERYCVWPGQACTYMLGRLAWRQGRDRAKARLGARFDIRKFHDAGLLAGAVPLALLDRILDGWTASQA